MLVPWITSRWEARDRALEAERARVEQKSDLLRAAQLREHELKAELVARIGVTSATFLSAIEVGVIRPDSEASIAEYRAMRRSALELASQVAAYFPKSLPFQLWRDYVGSLRNAYHLLMAPERGARNDWLDRLNRYFDRLPEHLNGLCREGSNATFDEALRRLVVRFRDKQEVIVREILDSPSTLTGTPTPDRTLKRKLYDSSLAACAR